MKSFPWRSLIVGASAVILASWAMNNVDFVKKFVLPKQQPVG